MPRFVTVRGDFGKSMTLKPRGMSCVGISLRPQDHAWIRGLADVANTTDRFPSEIALSLLRDHFKSVSDPVLFDELRAIAEEDESNLSAAVRKILKQQLERYASRPWAIPVNDPALRGGMINDGSHGLPRQ